MTRSTAGQPESMSVATASAGPPGRARNVSTRLSPNAAGQLNMPGGEGGRLLISAFSSPTLAGSVIVTGFGGFFPPWFAPRPIEIVTALAVAGTFLLAGTAGCQVTCASTRIAVLAPS